MSNTWWIGQEDLDADQKSIISLPIDGNYLIIGPPGCGKTNLLLLRANYMYLAGQKNILITVFTKALQEFISSGSEQYSFPVSKVQTCRYWQYDLLRQYGVQLNPPKDFYEQRIYLLEQVNILINERNLSNIYDCILLDEAQDYLPEEIEIFDKLSNRLFAVADDRQKIYDGELPFDVLHNICGALHRLKYHYRNGLNICRVADGIVKDTATYEYLANTSNYNESANPSIVEHFRCRDIDDQANRIIQKLDAQLKAYPGELIGVICPRREELMQLWHHISSSAFGDKATLQLATEHEPLQSEKPIIVTTFHGIKGLEVRSLYMAGCNLLNNFNYNRNMTYTAVTRAKTSLTMYYDGDIHGYLEKALDGLNPPPDLPDIKDVFGGKK